jgi:hypothetical protein
MPEFWLEQNLVGVCFVAVVGSLIGLIGLTCRSGRGVVAPTLMALLLGGGAAVLAGTGYANGLWLAPAFLAASCAVFATLRACWDCRAFTAMAKGLAEPRLHGALLLVGSPIAAVFWAWAVIPTVPEFEKPTLSLTEMPPRLKRIAATPGATDAGRTVPLYQRERNATPADLKAEDALAFAGGEYAGRALRTAPPSDDYNCHGWVFTDGRFGIQSETVDGILHDNGYRQVSEPRPGDLVIYRVDAAITHSGIVRTGGAGQPLLIESKWGECGRYVHAPQDNPYPGVATYYHSDRVGHVLRGLESTPTPPRVASTPQEAIGAQ